MSEAKSQASDGEARQAQELNQLNAKATMVFALASIGGGFLINTVGVMTLMVTLGMGAALSSAARFPAPAVSQLRAAMTYFAIGVFVTVIIAVLAYLARAFTFKEKGLNVVPMQIAAASICVISAFLFTLGAVTAAGAFTQVLGGG